VSLSVCCATSEPRRAAVVLAALRGVAQEIVVAVDVSGGERDLTPLGGLAGRLFEVELDTFPEPAMAWLHAQCAGDWVLRVDDDELPDGRLIEALPELIRARDVAQYWLARRWLYPGPASWLQEWTWFPDFQGRLVRNDARLWFPGLRHSGVAPARPARYLECGLYHFALLLGERGERERKVARYLAVDHALRETGVDAYLAECHVPERRTAIERAETAVDASDRTAVAQTLRRLLDRCAVSRPENAVSAGGEGGSCGAVRPRPVPPAEIRAHWAAREIPPDAYRATIEPVDIYRRIVAGDCRPFRVRVHNRGDEFWPGGEERRPLIRVAYRWLDTGGEVFEAEGVRTALPHPLAPGEACIVAMSVVAPAIAGRYVLAPDLVHEHVRWFGCESQPVEMLVIDANAASPEPARRGALAERAPAKAAPLEASL
jgi:hypothetical protein